MIDFLANVQTFLIGAVTTLVVATSSLLPSSPVSQPQQQPIVDSSVIVRSGQYTYSGQTLKYLVNIPKKGGKITGNFTGVCNGPITGTFDAGPGQSGMGKATATCPILLNKKLEATYVAHFDFNAGKAYIDWVGDLPYTSGKGSFTFDFEPVK
jgi:hypothetical protein